MNYTIINHGNWVPYTKDAVLSPEGFPLVPAGTIFCKRESDGVDWYDYSRAEGTFQPGSIKVVCLRTNLGLITQAIYAEATSVFPQNCTLIEVQGWEGEKPHRTFEYKVYDPETHTFSDIVLPAAPVITYKKDIWVRATDEEADIIDQVLSQQSTRKQRIFNEAQYLDHANPLFAELYAGFVQAFGTERADQLLAGSSD
ncbi:hypothetical protein [Methylobacterium sp. 37f]|uniref:hypothetical protein n=1 Tax=Methylobacterium sp. 37f TaxID=2817058 RepID=UPI001FFC3230|nr:hypothetical protein [Methylobacterium sp. 37f]MCK2056433.1 hypothetical protein [Methylobacterium sp. 37f]